MARAELHRIVARLPTPLRGAALYLVRVGGGFSLYATNHRGAPVAYSLNAPGIPATLRISGGGSTSRRTLEVRVTAADGAAISNAALQITFRILAGRGTVPSVRCVVGTERLPRVTADGYYRLEVVSDAEGFASIEVTGSGLTWSTVPVVVSCGHVSKRWSE